MLAGDLLALSATQIVEAIGRGYLSEVTNETRKS